MQCPVRSMLVVVREVFIEHQSQVAFAIDQQPIGALAAQCADPALADRVCRWCLDRGLDDLDAVCFEDRVEAGGVLGVAVSDQEKAPG